MSRRRRTEQFSFKAFNIPREFFQVNVVHVRAKSQAQQRITRNAKSRGQRANGVPPSQKHSVLVFIHILMPEFSNVYVREQCAPDIGNRPSELEHRKSIRAINKSFPVWLRRRRTDVANDWSSLILFFTRAQFLKKAQLVEEIVRPCISHQRHSPTNNFVSIVAYNSIYHPLQ